MPAVCLACLLAAFPCPTPEPEDLACYVNVPIVGGTTPGVSAGYKILTDQQTSLKSTAVSTTRNRAFILDMGRERR